MRVIAISRPFRQLHSSDARNTNLRKWKSDIQLLYTDRYFWYLGVPIISHNSFPRPPLWLVSGKTVDKLFLKTLCKVRSTSNQQRLVFTPVIGVTFRRLDWQYLAFEKRKVIHVKVKNSLCWWIHRDCKLGIILLQVYWVLSEEVEEGMKHYNYHWKCLHINDVTVINQNL